MGPGEDDPDLLLDFVGDSSGEFIAGGSGGPVSPSSEAVADAEATIWSRSSKSSCDTVGRIIASEDFRDFGRSLDLDFVSDGAMGKLSVVSPSLLLLLSNSLSSSSSSKREGEYKASFGMEPMEAGFRGEPAMGERGFSEPSLSSSTETVRPPRSEEIPSAFRRLLAMRAASCGSMAIVD